MDSFWDWVSTFQDWSNVKTGQDPRMFRSERKDQPGTFFERLYLSTPQVFLHAPATSPEVPWAKVPMTVQDKKSNHAEYWQKGLLLKFVLFALLLPPRDNPTFVHSCTIGLNLNVFAWCTPAKKTSNTKVLWTKAYFLGIRDHRSD